MPRPDDHDGVLGRDIVRLADSIAFGPHQNQRSHLVEELNRLRQRGEDPMEIDVALAVKSIYDEAYMAGQKVGATSVTNNVNVSNSNITGSAVGTGNTVNAKDISFSQKIVSNGAATGEMRAALEEALKALTEWSPSDPEMKADANEAFSKVAEEASKPATNSGRLMRLWNGFIGVADEVAKLKPIADLGIAITKLTGGA